MFLFLLSFITLGSESQIAVFKQCQSNTQMSVFFGGIGWKHGQPPKFGDSRLFSEKKIIRHFTRFNSLRLSLAFVLKYYPILHVVKR